MGLSFCIFIALKYSGLIVAHNSLRRTAESQFIPSSRRREQEELALCDDAQYIEDSERIKEEERYPKQDSAKVRVITLTTNFLGEGVYRKPRSVKLLLKTREARSPSRRRKGYLPVSGVIFKFHADCVHERGGRLGFSATGSP